MAAATGNFTAEINRSKSLAESFTESLMRFDYFNNVVQNLAGGIIQLSGAGIKLDSQMHDLSEERLTRAEGPKLW